tara:strand:+ start:2817 stop:5144 length:2328 start_codon:yes stop_codon:yes gene_type:complete
MNEADTRAELIDPQLKAAGWGEIDGSRIQREYSINSGEIRAGGIRAGQLKADYILIYKNRKLAVVEAKADELEVGEGVGQAKLYAQKLQLETSYAANGKAIYEICLKTGKEGEIGAFPSPDDLWNKTFGDANEWRDKFDDIPLDTVGDVKQARYYQEIAVNKTIEAIANNKNRILLTLATGTGKTFIASQIAWKLFKSRWNLQRDGKRTPRILFLADRNILANQAYLDFGSFSEDALTRIKPSEISKRGGVPTNASVFFTIFQTFMSGAKGEPYFGQYPEDFFDFIIVDECHRGGANDESSWREILDYFHPAVQLGLTATPKRKDNVDTYAYFGEPVYKYSLKEGIQDGFLTPFKVKRIQTTIDEYIYASDDEVVDGEVEEGKVYEEKDFNKIIEIEARERKRVQDMLASINSTEKTLVFCANQAHAAKIRDIINQESDSTKVDYCVRVTANDGAIGETHLRTFQDNDKEIPTILTTSQKLSTGVDARNIRNIVLMRPVNSMIEFKQIIGRGTRLFDGKHYFTIIDFVNAYHLFNDPEWDGEPIEPDPVEPFSPKPGDPEIPPEYPDDPDNPDDPDAPARKVKIKLKDGKEREIQSMSSTMFFVDGNVVGSEEFFRKVFDTLQLPELFDSEDKLKELWANPITRRELLERLENEGCSKGDLLKLQEMIDAEDSDLFDVLEYISYAHKPISRKERVSKAEDNIYALLNAEQKEFIEFVLSNYIKDGVDELDDSKLGKLITLKYKSNTDAERVLGDLGEIRNVFIDFQKHLYIENVG